MHWRGQGDFIESSHQLNLEAYTAAMASELVLAISSKWRTLHIAKAAARSEPTTAEPTVMPVLVLGGVPASRRAPPAALALSSGRCRASSRCPPSVAVRLDLFELKLKLKLKAGWRSCKVSSNAQQLKRRQERTQTGGAPQRSTASNSSFTLRHSEELLLSVGSGAVFWRGLGRGLGGMGQVVSRCHDVCPTVAGPLE